MVGRRLHKRRDAPEQRGLHIAGTDGSFSDAVMDESIPRCVVEECQVLFADAPPPFSDTMCESCRQAFAEAEEESRRAAELRGDAA